MDIEGETRREDNDRWEPFKLSRIRAGEGHKCKIF